MSHIAGSSPHHSGDSSTDILGASMHLNRTESATDATTFVNVTIGDTPSRKVVVIAPEKSSTKNKSSNINACAENSSSAGTPTSSEAFRLRTQGETLCKANDVDEGISVLEASAVMYAAESTVSTGALHAAEIYNLIGETLREMGDVDRALSYFAKALRIESSMIPNSLELAATLESVGDCCFDTGLHAKALQLYRQSCAIVSAKFESCIAEAKLRDKICLVLQSQQLLAEAEAEAWTSLKIKEQHVKAPSSPLCQDDSEHEQEKSTVVDLALGCNTIGSILYAQCKLQGALDNFSRSLKLLESASSNGSHNQSAASDASGTIVVETAKTLSYLGDVHDSMGKTSSAISFYRRSIDQYERVRHLHDRELLHDTCRSIASLYRSQGKVADADVFERKIVQQ